MNRKKGRKAVYVDAPPDIEEALDSAVRVKDFLPPPESLILKEETEKITIALSKRSLGLFRDYAKKHGAKYQNMIRRLVDTYAERSLAKTN